MPSDKSLVFDFVFEYQQAVDRGEMPDLAVLCQARPDLIPQVQQKLAIGGQVANANAAFAKAVANEIDHEPMPKKLGRYDLQSELGNGTYGVAYVGRDSQLDRDVAVKLLRRKHRGKADATRRFLDEARITAQLQHPAIPSVHEMGTHDDGRPWMAMKLVRGETLTVRLGQNDPKFNPLTAFEAVCQGLDYAHSKGVVHRDLKPDNVMVGKFGEVQLMDWGLAKVLSPATTSAASGDETIDTAILDTPDDEGAGSTFVVGSPAYMPPEQAAGAVNLVDQRSDVFGLGAILCKMLTGKPPFVSGNAESTRQMAAMGKVQDAYARLDACAADPELVALCKRCLSPEKSDRPASAGEVATAVAALRAAADERVRQAEMDKAKAEVQADEERKRLELETRLNGEKLATERKRRRVLFIASFTVVLVLLVGVTVSLWLMLRANEAENLATKREKDTAKERDAKDIALANEFAERTKAQAAAKAEEVAKLDAEGSNTDLWAGLDAMTAEIVGHSLGTQKTISEEQKKFLRSVLPLYQKLAGKKGNDEKTRARVGLAAFRIGLIKYRIGGTEEGAFALQQARDAFGALSIEFPAAPDYRSHLAWSHGNLGVLLAGLGKRAEAEEQYRKALALLERLAADFPAAPDYRSDLATSHNNLGNLLADVGKQAEAGEQYRKGLVIQQKLAADFPAAPDYRRQLAASHGNGGLLLADVGKRAEAEEQFKQGLALLERLAADFPAAPDYRSDLATSHNNLGLLLAGLGKQAEADEQFRKALAVQEKLAAEFPASPTYRSDLARSHSNLGAMLQGVGKQAEADEQFRKALVIQEKLAADFPAAPDYRSDLAKSYGNVGVLLADVGKRAEAVAQFRKAMAIQEKLAAEFPASPAYRSDLARGRNNLGATLQDVGKQAEAEEQYRQASALLEKLAADSPAVPDYRRRLAVSHTCLAVLLADLGKRAEAEEQYKQGLALLEKLVADFPAVPEYRVELGGSYCNLGNLTLYAGEPAEGLKWFGRAIDRLQTVHEKERRDVTAKQFLRNSHWSRAKAFDVLGKHAEAVKDWDKAITLSPHAQQLQLRAARATSRLNAGMVAEAVAEVAELTKSPNWNASQWYDFACVYAVTSGKIADNKQEYADRAMELLAKAVKAGWKDAAHMKRDKDLDPLRERDDFKKLVAELEKKFPPLPELAPPPRPVK